MTIAAKHARAYRLADNRSGEFSTWDLDVLPGELAALPAAQLEALPALDFDAIVQPPSLDGQTDPDDIPEAPKPRTKRGDVWTLGDHRLMCGDSTDAGDIARLLDGVTADILLTDPPYGKLKIFTGNTVGKDNAAKCKQYDAKAYQGEGTFRLEPVLLAASGSYKRAVIWGGNYFADVLPITTAWLVWDKRAGARSWYSDCELAWSDLRTTARVFTFTWQGMIRQGEHVERTHPTQKPVELMEWILTKLAPKTSTVLDLFVGSGTTIIAAEREKRRCYGMEISPAYVDVAVARWEAFTGRTATR